MCRVMCFVSSSLHYVDSTNTRPEVKVGGIMWFTLTEPKVRLIEPKHSDD